MAAATPNLKAAFVETSFPNRMQKIADVSGHLTPQTLKDELPKLNRDVPRDLATIVHKTIDRDPAHRYQSARELSEDLQRFLEDEPIKARRVSVTERLTRWSRRNKGLAASLATVALFTIALLLLAELATFPLVFYRSFVLERRYGLLTASAPVWLRDHLKGLALTLIVGVLGALAVYAALTLFPAAWWLVGRRPGSR